MVICDLEQAKGSGQRARNQVLMVLALWWVCGKRPLLVGHFPQWLCVPHTLTYGQQVLYSVRSLTKVNGQPNPDHFLWLTPDRDPVCRLKTFPV